MLILICGLPATGKSTGTDIIRKGLIKNPQYSEDEKEQVYNAVFLIADYLIKADVNVIIDGTFYRESLRNRAREIAKKRNKRFFLIETRCPEDIVLKRLEGRKRNLRSPSDADLDVYYKIKGIFEKIEGEHIEIETGWNIREAIRDVVKKIKA
jgi:predicted kinase